MTNMQPNCWTCKHRGSVPGSAHICCKHPSIPESSDMTRVLAILASVGRIKGPPVVGVLGVTGDPYGIDNGWFIWPHNFDPCWLLTCDGYEKEDPE